MTGVQTCALPIYAGIHPVYGALLVAAGEEDEGEVMCVFHLQLVAKARGVVSVGGVGGAGRTGVDVGVDGFLDDRIVTFKDGVDEFVVVSRFPRRPDVGVGDG